MLKQNIDPIKSSKSLEKDWKSLSRDKKKQLESIELAIKLNKSQIELQEEIDVISERFKLQPNIL